MTESTQNAPLKRTYGRLLQGLRYLLFLPTLYLIWHGKTWEPTLLLGGIFLSGYFLFFSVNHDEVEKPYSAYWLKTVDSLLIASVMGVLFFQEWKIEGVISPMLLMGWIFTIIRTIVVPIYAFSQIRLARNLLRSFWSKLASLSLIVTLGIYCLRIEHFKQISMGISVLLLFAAGLAFLYKFYRDPIHRKPLSIASQLTVSRIVLTPVFIWVFFYDNNLIYTDNNVIFKSLALLMVILFMLTDFLDGYLARKMNEVSVLGKFLDPFSDKISNMTIFLCFMASGYASIWMVALIYFREASIETLRTLAASQNEIIAARQSGKYKTAIQGFGILLILVNALAKEYLPIYPFQEQLPWATMWIITWVTLLSGVDYFYSSRKILAKFL